MRRLEDASLDIYQPGSIPSRSSYDLSVPQEDILSIETTKKLDATKDQATIVLDDSDTSYLTDIPLHSQIDVSVTFPSGTEQIFTAYPHDREHVRNSATEELTLQCHDFVFGLLGDRTLSDKYQDRQVAGTSTSIVNLLVDRATDGAELDTSQIATNSDTFSIQFRVESALRVLRQVSERAGGLLASDGTSLVYQQSKTGTFGNRINVDGTSRLIEPVRYRESDAELKNRVIVTGGEGATAFLDTIANQNGFKGVAKDQKGVDRVSGYTKSKVASVTLDINSPGQFGIGERLRVRLQELDSNGDPVDRNNPALDLGRGYVVDKNITAFQTVRRDVQINADGIPSEFAVIVDSDLTLADGGGGFAIAVNIDESSPTAYIDSQDELTYKLNYPYNVIVPVEDVASQDQYLRVDARKNVTVPSKGDARQIGQAVLGQDKTPERFFEFEAAEVDQHTLEPLDLVGLIDSTIGDGGGSKWVVRRVDRRYEDNLLETTIEMQDLDSLTF